MDSKKKAVTPENNPPLCFWYEFAKLLDMPFDTQQCITFYDIKAPHFSISCTF